MNPPRIKRYGIIAAGVLAVAMAIACGAGSTSKTDSASAGEKAGAAAGSTAKVTSKPAVKSTPKTLMSFKGKGIKNSPKFTTGDDWTIKYSYDCSDFGYKGNFIITISDDFGDGVNELGKSGKDSQPVYGQSGTHYLSVNSECSWSVSVVG
jgi:hypothetical protein